MWRIGIKNPLFSKYYNYTYLLFEWYFTIDIILNGMGITDITILLDNDLVQETQLNDTRYPATYKWYYCNTQ